MVPRCCRTAPLDVASLNRSRALKRSDPAPLLYPPHSPLAWTVGVKAAMVLLTIRESCGRDPTSLPYSPYSSLAWVVWIEAWLKILRRFCIRSTRRWLGRSGSRPGFAGGSRGLWGLMRNRSLLVRPVLVSRGRDSRWTRGGCNRC